MSLVQFQSEPPVLSGVSTKNCADAARFALKKDPGASLRSNFKVIAGGAWATRCRLLFPRRLQRREIDLRQLLLQNLPGLEFHHRAPRDSNVNARLVRVATDAWLPPLDFEAGGKCRAKRWAQSRGRGGSRIEIVDFHEGAARGVTYA